MKYDFAGNVKYRYRDLDPGTESFSTHVPVWKEWKDLLSELLSSYSRKDCKTLSDKELKEARELRDAKAPRTFFQKFFDSLPELPRLPTDKEIEEFNKQYPRPFMPIPGRKIPFPLVP